ncbi:hypothetical protein SNEBB_010056 [Seison nebaliae]|nr:hypothetical protein SNEBB_010056 [Seison nebaliae]
MGLCKCPNRKVTSLFCFHHRTNVCEKCILSDHPQCVVRTYVKWLEDNDYNDLCVLCDEQYSQSKTIRLLCLDVVHLNCLDRHISRLNEQNPSLINYKCPVCQAYDVIPKSNVKGRIADILRKELIDFDWAKIILGITNMKLENEEEGRSPENVLRKHMSDNSFEETNEERDFHRDYSIDFNGGEITSSIPNAIYRNHDDDNSKKYQKPSIFLKLKRRFRSAIKLDRPIRYKWTLAVLMFIIFFLFMIFLATFHSEEHIHRSIDVPSRDYVDDKFDPHNNPNVHVDFHLNKLFANSIFFIIIFIIFSNCQLMNGEELEDSDDTGYPLDLLFDDDDDVDHVISYTTNLTMIGEFMTNLQMIMRRESKNILLKKQLFHMNVHSLSHKDGLLLEKNSSTKHSTLLQFRSTVKYEILLLDMVSELKNEMEKLIIYHKQFTLRLIHESNMLLISSKQLIELFVIQMIFCGNLSISSFYTVHKVKNEYLDEMEAMNTVIISKEIIPISTIMNHSVEFMTPLCSFDIISEWTEGNETDTYLKLKFLLESFTNDLNLENMQIYSKNVSQLMDIDNQFIHLSMTQLPLSICYVTFIDHSTIPIPLLPNCLTVHAYYQTTDRYLYNLFLVFIIYIFPFIFIMTGYYFIHNLKEKYSNETDLSSYPKIKKMRVGKFINKLEANTNKSKKSDMKMETLLEAIRMNMLDAKSKENEFLPKTELSHMEKEMIERSRNGYENQSFRSCVSSTSQIAETTITDCEEIKSSEEKFNDVMDFIQLARVKCTINKCLIIPKK